jgi:hypothetical protein
VVSPPTARSVKATWETGLRIGWQHKQRQAIVGGRFIGRSRHRLAGQLILATLRKLVGAELVDHAAVAVAAGVVDVTVMTTPSLGNWMPLRPSNAALFEIDEV